MESISFFNCPLPLDQVFGLLNNPRNLSKEEFMCLVTHLSLSSIKKINDRTIFNQELNVFNKPFDVLIKLEMFPSKTEIRKAIKSNSVFVNKRQLKEENVFLITDFLKTSINDDMEELRFAIIRHGKKAHEIVFGWFKI